MPVSFILLIVVVITFLYIYISNKTSIIIRCHPNSNASSAEIDFATKIVNRMMALTPDSFEISQYGIYQYGDLAFSFESLGYANLSTKYDVIKLANLIVQVAKEKYPNNDWLITAEYSNGNAYGNTFRTFRHAKIALKESPKQLKHIF